jgi:hypothetical protein
VRQERIYMFNVDIHVTKKMVLVARYQYDIIKSCQLSIPQNIFEIALNLEEKINFALYAS